MKPFAALLVSTVLPITLAANVNVLFRVDMTEQAVSPSGVHMAGSFGSAGYPQWNPSGIALSDANADNIYEVELSLPENTYFEYKFINGNAWGADESVPGACNCNGNRCLTTGVSDEVRPVFCFGSCSFCGSNPQFRSVTFRLDMQNQVVSPNGVHLAGSFGFNPAPFTYPMWNPGGIAMSDADADLVYEVTLQLAEGYFFEFKYVNGNAWGAEESVPAACNVFSNRFVTVPTAATVLPQVCFGSCVDCTPLTNVVFQVDMQDQVVSPQGVHLAGNFGNVGLPVWDPAGISMDDGDGDGVYNVAFDLLEGFTYEYKFINGNAWGADESVPAACAVGFNRSITVPVDAVMLPEVCFGSCIDCPQPGCTDADAVNFDPEANTNDGSCLYQVNLSVDMNAYTGTVSEVFVAGSWNAFSTAAEPLADADLNGVWTTTLWLGAGNYEYLYYAAGASEFESFLSGEPCTVNTGSGNNRAFSVNDSPVTLPVYCWNSCFACQSVPVTFSVNMTGITLSPDGVHLAGNFNGWLPTLMTDNGNNIWSLTATMQAGNSYEYKFINGDFLDTDAEGITGGCTTGPLGNRFFTAPFNPFNLPTYCYAQCTACPLQITVTFRVDMANESIAPEGLHLAGSFNGWSTLALPMNYLGYNIYEASVSLSPFIPVEYKYINGDAWGEEETVPPGCALNGNRYLGTGFSDILLPVVCYGECSACGGCTDPFASNFNPFAAYDDGSCAGPVIYGCTYPAAVNYNPTAHVDDGSCVCAEVTDNCPADFDENGVVNVGDLLTFMGFFGSFCP